MRTDACTGSSWLAAALAAVVLAQGAFAAEEPAGQNEAQKPGADRAKTGNTRFERRNH